MNTVDFAKMCRDASEKLGLGETAALGLGASVSVRDVDFEAAHTDGQDSFLLLADLGAIAPDDRVSVYETMLAMQLADCHDARVRFGFHPMHEAAVLCVGAALTSTTNGAWLASLLDAVALQVTHWRRDKFAGKARRRSQAPDDAGFGSAIPSPV